MTSHVVRRSLVAAASALVLLVVPVSAAYARPTPNQFATMMQKALVAKAPTYHLTKAQVNAAFKNAPFRSNMYTAGAIICQKLSTESSQQAATDLVTLTSSLLATANSGGSNQGTPMPPRTSPQKLSLALIKGVVGVGMEVTTAKGSLCPQQHSKALVTLKLYNKAVGAKLK